MSGFLLTTTKKEVEPKIAVIGAGVAGIAAAIRLAIKGYQVDVFEANAYPGGKLSEIQGKGYRFDAGPSLFTLPHLVDELFILSGKRPSDFFTYERLYVVCKYFYEDGIILNAYGDKKKFIEEITSKTTEKESALNKFFDHSEFLYNTLAHLFMQKSLHKWNTFISAPALKAYLRIPGLNFFKTMNEANEAYFEDNHVTQIFNRYATYNGSDPFKTPATMNIIPHLEYQYGAFFPKGGMYSITSSLVKLAEESGVRFHYNSHVNKILIENKKVVGLEILGERLNYSRVVNNMDMVNTYKKLLPQENPPKRLLSQPKSSSALIFYWGIGQSFKELELHNIFFSKDYKKEFEHIFNKRDICDDPTIYINISSKHKPDDAPVNCENWFVMINVPNNSGQDWDLLIKKARENILDKLTRLLKKDIRALIEFEHIMDPRSIESKTSSFQGALYGNSSNNKYAAFLRHANFSSRIQNLYFCGGSVHPGGGIPLCLLSAKIVSDLIPDYCHSKNVKY